MVLDCEGVRVPKFDQICRLARIKRSSKTSWVSRSTFRKIGNKTFRRPIFCFFSTTMFHRFWWDLGWLLGGFGGFLAPLEPRFGVIFDVCIWNSPWKGSWILPGSILMVLERVWGGFWRSTFVFFCVSLHILVGSFGQPDAQLFTTLARMAEWHVGEFNA